MAHMDFARATALQACKRHRDHELRGAALAVGKSDGAEPA
jgi:hypothetical protein